MIAWQPIGTAPRDGTEVILHGGGYSWVGRFYSKAYYNFGVLERTSEGWSSAQDFYVGGAIGPTHWLPLPPAPKVHEEPGNRPVPGTLADICLRALDGEFTEPRTFVGSPPQPEDGRIGEAPLGGDQP